MCFDGCFCVSAGECLFRVFGWVCLSVFGCLRVCECVCVCRLMCALGYGT